MSEYCSQCSPFKPHFDINLVEIALELEKGESEYFICEGCENRGIFKDLEGRLFLKKDNNGDISFLDVNIEQLLKD